MARKPIITIIGASSIAMALAPALHRAGYQIDEVIVRNRRESRRRAQALAKKVGARAATFATATGGGDLFWICVSDSAIAECARLLAQNNIDWNGRFAFHCSGALTSEELAPLRRLGAAVASLHPMMTFVRRSAPSLQGVGFGVEGDADATRLARKIVQDLGGHIFTIRTSAKALYHAWGGFASALLIMDLALAEQVARAAGVSPADARRTVEPIVRRAIDNYFAHGAAASFSGPLVRGDVETVKRHLAHLSKVKDAREVYVALARSALRTLPVARRKEMHKLLYAPPTA
jgi:predicted short-subunit dehydrogenase-like oxidoreductase (DUF2520 family)